MVQFGPVDYAMSIRLAGQSRHPAVRETERYVIETALKHGILPRAELEHPSAAEEYPEMGVRHFCLGTAVSILYSWLGEHGQAMRGLIQRQKGRGPSPTDCGASSIHGHYCIIGGARA